MGQEEIFRNIVIDMYHKTKQVANPPLPSEVPVIKKSYPGIKWSTPGEKIKFLYVTVWILHMGVSWNVFQSWYYFVFCLQMVMSQFYQAVKRLQEAGRK